MRAAKFFYDAERRRLAAELEVLEVLQVLQAS